MVPIFPIFGSKSNVCRYLFISNSWKINKFINLINKDLIVSILEVEETIKTKKLYSDLSKQTLKVQGPDNAFCLDFTVELLNIYWNLEFDIKFLIAGRKWECKIA